MAISSKHIYYRNFVVYRDFLSFVADYKSSGACFRARTLSYLFYLIDNYYIILDRSKPVQGSLF